MTIVMIILGILLYLVIGAFIGGVAVEIIDPSWDDIDGQSFKTANLFLWPAMLLLYIGVGITCLFLKVSILGKIFVAYFKHQKWKKDDDQ